MGTKKTVIIFLLLIALANITIYAKSAGYDFVNFDDSEYVYENPDIHKLNPGVIFSTTSSGNYQPLVLLSYAVEEKYFGLKPKAYHITNIALHVINGMLVFFLIYLITGEAITALIVALFFSLHPVQVESVAWISERKGLMCTFFYLLSFIAYIRYEKLGRREFYYLCIVLFIGALLSKPMALTFPIILILYDWYKEKLTKAKLLEKVPLVFLSGASAIITLMLQERGAAIRTEKLPHFLYNIFFAFYNVGFYVIKLLAPMNLSVHYGYIEKIIPASAEFYAVLAVIIVAGLYMRYFNRINRRVNFGLLFFLVSLIPILRLVPIGETLAADRYLYIPSIGFIFAAVSLIYPYVADRKLMKRVAIGAASIYLVFLTNTANSQLPTWKNSDTLWRNVLKYNPDYYNAYIGVGYFNVDKTKDYKLAREFFTKAMNLNDPRGVERGLYGMGESYFMEHRPSEAIVYFDRLVNRIRDNKSDLSLHSYLFLGGLSIEAGSYDNAERYYKKGLHLFPDSSSLHAAYANYLEHYDRLDEAEEQFRLAARCKKKGKQDR